MFLVADAPPHDHVINRTLDAVQSLRKQIVAIFPVAASGVREKAEFLMRATAFLTNAQYLFLTDHSGVGNPHAKPQTSQFNVERLDQLMIRMIIGELAGRKLLPTDIIATEGELPYGNGQSEPQQTSMVQPSINACGVGGFAGTQPMYKSTWFRCLVIGLTMVGCCILDRVC